MKTKEHLHSLLDDFSNGMLVTKRVEGTLHGRPMHVAKRDGDTLWFMTDRDSAKLDELENDSRVSLTFQKSDRFVAMSALADVVTDKAKIQSLWNPAWRIWFPKGPEAHDLVAVKITPLEAEYWDNSGIVNKIKFVKQAVEALVTNSTPDVDDPAQHGQIQM